MNNVLTVEALFSGKVLHVPDYQRGYSWERDQWKDFIDDLEYLSSGKHHYTGTVVLHEQKESVRDLGGTKHTVFHVVDGQQRLTTIVLLLDCIRRAIRDTNPNLADGIGQNYLEFKDINGQPAFKLKLNSDCHEYFVRNVLADPSGPQGPTIASHQRLRGAHVLLSSYVAGPKSRLGDGYTAWLFALYEKVVSQLMINLYTVEQASEVGVIFETMNNRGKSLSELEKVKNYLLYISSKLDLDDEHDLDGQINSTWAEIFQRLMSSGLTSAADEDRLLRAHWLMACDPSAREWSGIASVKRKFNLKDYHTNHAMLLSDLSTYTAGLKDSVLPFAEAFRPNHSDAFGAFPSERRASVKASADKLRRVGVIAPFLPLLIATRLQFPTDATKYDRLLRMCEIYAFRVYHVGARRADAGQPALFRMGNALRSGEMSLDDVLTLMRQWALAFCPNRTLEQYCDLDSERSWYGTKSIKYVLYEFEEHLAGSHGVNVSWDQISKSDQKKTIEHILPQNPTNTCWLDRFKPGELRRLTHDIGNLCLTEDNSVYGNKCFEQKRGVAGQGRCYANSNLFQERAIAAYSDWTPESLIERRNQIVAWFMDRWHLEDDDISESELTDKEFEEEIDEELQFTVSEEWEPAYI